MPGRFLEIPVFLGDYFIMPHPVYSIEKVQKKFTKRLPGCNSLTYIERRNKLNLTTLELRRLYYDLVIAIVSQIMFLCIVYLCK